jgi:hypothetical protein
MEAVSRFPPRVGNRWRPINFWRLLSSTPTQPRAPRIGFRWLQRQDISHGSLGPVLADFDLASHLRKLLRTRLAELL